MLVFSEHITPRLKYILEYIFNDRLGINVTIETDIERFMQDGGLRLNYSNKQIEGVYKLIPSGLLFEAVINHEKPEIGITNGSIHLFPLEEGSLKFDVFSACFWMLSRYEEYQAYKADDHGRFLSSQSFSAKHDFVARPIVDEWIMDFKSSLKEFYTDIRFKVEKFQVIPTIDIDSPWCYRHKGLLRNMGGFIRDALTFNVSELPERLYVVSRLKKDAHFQFNWLSKLFNELKLDPIYFLLVGDYGRYDKTISRTSKAFQTFLADIMSKNEIGIHPSYKAAYNESVFKSEKEYLEQIGDIKINKSRQHFLKFRLPEYYELLLKQGIKEDYSMGFADNIGFRAGTSKPFYFYNLHNEEATNLSVHPFSVMDVSLAQYQALNPDKALSIIKELVLNLKKVNGDFVSLWHNESLSDRMQWKGWKKVYAEILSLATS